MEIKLSIKGLEEVKEAVEALEEAIKNIRVETEEDKKDE